eukprot:1481571-Alexandrium_andersonii.AAC.1
MNFTRPATTTKYKCTKPVRCKRQRRVQSKNAFLKPPAVPAGASVSMIFDVCGPLSPRHGPQKG